MEEAEEPPRTPPWTKPSFPTAAWHPAPSLSPPSWFWGECFAFLKHQDFIKSTSHSRMYTFSLWGGGVTTFYSNSGPGNLAAAWSPTKPACDGAALVDRMPWARLYGK